MVPQGNGRHQSELVNRRLPLEHRAPDLRGALPLRQTRALLTALVVLSTLFANVSIATEGAGATLHALFDAEWERDLQENPDDASRKGVRAYDDRWPDLGLEAIERSHRRDVEVLAALDRMDRSALTTEDQLNWELFRRIYQGRVDSYRRGEHLLPVNQRGGVQSRQELAESLPFATAQDYENWLQRMRAMDTLLAQTTELMREGVRRGLTQPRVIMERVPAQVAKQVVADPEKSPFYLVFEGMPALIPTAEQARLRASAREVIATTIVPAYRRFGEFLEREYLPACRTSVGVWDTPGGDAWYQNRIEWFTTTTLTASQIHQLGLGEVARIRAEMQKIVDRVGFEGSLSEFIVHLRTDPRFRYQDPQELLRAYESVAKRIDPLLPKYFGKLPRMPYGVRPIPEQIAPDTTTAYYSPSSLDGRRAGYYYVNLYLPEERPKYEIPVLTIHEAVPGHHLQIALAQELQGLPKFRADGYLTVFGEGWALYSESLGEEMGLYADPYDKFGQLTYEMWRAVRLVVDTGLHHERWTRQQAIDFFKANAPKTELDIVNEIDRYIAWPGQALAYKIGELKIKELRRRASEALGPLFDLREFHDVVLGSGGVPLNVLQRNVEQWQRSKSRS
jgi:uncharacterized protein (DUF885 family)